MKKILIVLLILGIIIFSLKCKDISKETILIKIINKESIIKDGEHKYLIFTENEVFENTDSIFHFKLNNSDIQNSLKKNNEYIVQVYGYRIPIFSMYRNIIKIGK